MLHAPSTRASGRTAALARAHADVTSRQPAALSIALGALLAVAITAGTASAAAAAEAAERDPVTVASLASAATVRPADTAVPTDAPGSASMDAMSVQVTPASSDVAAGVAEEAVGTLKDAQKALVDANAATTEVAASGLALDPQGATSVGTSELTAGINALANTNAAAGLRVVLSATALSFETQETVAQTADLRASLATAKEKKAEADRAAAAAEAARKEAEAQAAALAAANTPEGAKATARQMAASRYGWGDGQFSCLASLWTKESGWNYQAYNPNGGATGIPQALPGSKMASAGGDWRTNAATQIAWGLDYINRAYGSPCSAWGHSQSVNWY
ncbi:phospholipase [Microbacterium sp.]|uniref:aggregation-promoting factor C-terminal-like domain-containing protein n=1 Tax=Microbacterium sp. TaxID=51671 RepID=UPI00333EB4B6